MFPSHARHFYYITRLPKPSSPLLHHIIALSNPHHTTATTIIIVIISSAIKTRYERWSLISAASSCVRAGGVLAGPDSKAAVVRCPARPSAHPPQNAHLWPTYTSFIPQSHLSTILPCPPHQRPLVYLCAPSPARTPMPTLIPEPLTTDHHHHHHQTTTTTTTKPALHVAETKK